MKILNCTFTLNHAKEGGAIYTLGNITIEGSTFTSNDAYKNILGSEFHAGAIFIKGDQSSIKNSIFDSNYANVYGAIYFEGLNLTLNNCSFKSNRAGDSGAIRTKGKFLQVNNCTFESNNGSAGYGGAINSQGTNINISNSTFRENFVAGQSGGSLSLDKSDVVIFNSTFELNDGGHNGGAIYAKNDNNIKIIASSFKSNYAAWYGGAIYLCSSNDPNPFNGILNISDSIFESNLVDLTYGLYAGAIAAYGNDAYLFIYNTTFKSNHAMEGAGAIDTGIPTNISNCTFENNNASDVAGAIYTNLNLNITNCNFKNNSANTGGAIGSYDTITYIHIHIHDSNFTSNNGIGDDSLGGAIFLIRAEDFKITDSLFKSNNATSGGAIYSGGNNFTIFNTTYELNFASEFGGAIYSTGDYAIVDLAYFNANKAFEGSAIYLRNQKEDGTKISNVAFGRNKANALTINIAVPENKSLGPSNATVNVTFEGGDNIANAIFNPEALNTVLLKNITCEFSKDGKGRFTKTFNENDFAHPTDGFEDESKL